MLGSRAVAPVVALAAVSCAAVLPFACARAESAESHGRTSAAAPDRPHRVRVLASGSLRDVFARIGRAYESAHPGAQVELEIAGSLELLERLNGGEIADVVAISDTSTMSRVSAGGHLAVGSAREFARNAIAVAVPAGNPGNVRDLTDLARPGLRVALGTRSSSIGRHARWCLSRANLDVRPAHEASTADGVLEHVRKREADAGVVYVTSFRRGEADVAGVERIDVPAALNTRALYSIGTVRMAKDSQAALAFRDFVLGQPGQALLREAGFQPPD
jgi:molybdate transport system substrate-binding protein